MKFLGFMGLAIAAASTDFQHGFELAVADCLHVVVNVDGGADLEGRVDDLAGGEVRLFVIAEYGQ